MDGCLVVVSRTRSELWHELVSRHAALPGVEVVRDRRREASHGKDGADRRIAAELGTTLESDGFVGIARSAVRRGMYERREVSWRSICFRTSQSPADGGSASGMIAGGSRSARPCVLRDRDSVRCR